MEKRKKILIVDDEPDILKLNRYIFQSMGFDVLEAGNGEEALKQFSMHMSQLDLIILDLTMPVMDGFETYKQIQNQKPEIKVIFITGFDDVWDANKFKQMENVRFLRKPYQVTDLMQAVNSLIDND